MLNQWCFIHDINWRQGWLAKGYSCFIETFLSMWMYWATKVIISGKKNALRNLSKTCFQRFHLLCCFFSGWNKRGSGKSIVWPSLYSLYYSGHFYVGYFPPPGHKVAIKKIFHFLLNQHTFYLLKSDNVWFSFKQRLFCPQQPFTFKNKNKHLATELAQSQSSIIYNIRSYALNNTFSHLKRFLGFPKKYCKERAVVFVSAAIVCVSQFEY